VRQPASAKYTDKVEATNGRIYRVRLQARRRGGRAVEVTAAELVKLAIRTRTSGSCGGASRLQEAPQAGQLEESAPPERCGRCFEERDERSGRCGQWAVENVGKLAEHRGSSRVSRIARGSSAYGLTTYPAGLGVLIVGSGRQEPVTHSWAP